MNTVIDLFVLYKIIRKLITPFKSMPAFKMGLIDENGNFLKSRDQLTDEEKQNLTYLDIFVINIKKILGKIPAGKTQLATFAAAMLLLRQKPIKEDIDIIQLEKDLLEQMKELEEEIPTTNASSGAIAGIGVGSKGEPGFTPNMINKYKKKNKKQSADIVTLMSRIRK